MQIGVCVHHNANKTREAFKKMTESGFFCCQLISWNPTLWTDEEASHIRAAAEEFGVTITAFWCGYTGPVIWNFYEGQETLGLVPVAYRHQRMNEILAGASFAQKLGVKDVVTHVGYLPENPYNENFAGVVVCIRHIADQLKEAGQNFLFETGQETPVTLLRTIEEIGRDNVFINLDTANLILYGKGNPVDALDVFGKYVKGVHCKDGRFPTNGKDLGEEVPIGEGKADLCTVIKKLHALSYPGTLTIEREIEGAQQDVDILNAYKLLTSYIKKAEEDAE